MEGKESLRERVQQEISKPKNKEVTITFPVDVWRRLSKYAFENTDNCWWLAIDRLLIQDELRDYFNQELRLLADRDDVLAMEIQRLQTKELKTEPKKTHFGKED